MKLFNSILCLSAAMTLLVGCSTSVQDDAPVTLPQTDVEACFMLSTDAVSRTTLADDGASINWQIGDVIAMWGYDSTGSYLFENEPFQLVRFTTEYTKAYFSGHIPELGDEAYTYLMCTPVPQSVNGTEVSYTLPSLQSGEYDGKYDVMVASPVESGSITANKDVEFEVSLHHKMHALNITIPEGGNAFGSTFTKLELTFPTPVVGDITFDVANPDAEPTYTNLSNVITVENSKGFNEGDSIWVFVLPGMVEGDVSYTVRSEGQRSVERVSYISRDMKPGHVTPINMTTPDLYKYTAMHFSVGQNNLGEDFNTFTLYDHNNEVLRVFNRNAENRYTIDFEGDIDLSSYQNKVFRAVFDTPHAVVECPINMGNVQPYCEQNITPMILPYLYEQDFSQIPSFDDGHDNPNTGFSSDTYNSSNLLDSYTSILAGWSGGRIGGSAGQSVRICCRFEGGLGASAYYKGRVDTAPMTKLKSGASVKVSVSFSYSAAKKEYGVGNGSTTLSFGHTTASGAIAPSSNIENTVISAETIDGTDGSYSNIYNTRTVSFSGCTNATRLSWQAGTTRGSSIAGNGNYWLYLDNIKVQIAQ